MQPAVNQPSQPTKPTYLLHLADVSTQHTPYPRYCGSQGEGTFRETKLIVHHHRKFALVPLDSSCCFFPFSLNSYFSKIERKTRSMIFIFLKSGAILVWVPTQLLG